MVLVKKILDMSIFAIFEVYLPKIAKKPLFAIISAICFRGRPLRFFYLLLEFFSELQNSFCKILPEGLSKSSRYGILNFYRKPKWHHLEVCIRKKGVNANFQVVPFWFAIKIQNSISTSCRQSFCEYFAKRILQFR